MGIPDILLHSSPSTAAYTAQDAANQPEGSLMYLIFVHRFINPRSILVRVLHMMLPQYGIDCQTTFDLLLLWQLLERNSNHTFLPKPIHHSNFLPGRLCGTDLGNGYGHMIIDYELVVAP